jgi:hypothetical protein
MHQVSFIPLGFEDDHEGEVEEDFQNESETAGGAPSSAR